MSLIKQPSTRRRSFFGLRNECATAGDYEITDFFISVASIPRDIAWNLLCHFVTQAVVIARLVRNCASERVIQYSNDSRD
jgi:hypothetical protein